MTTSNNPLSNHVGAVREPPSPSVIPAKAGIHLLPPHLTGEE